MNFTLIKNTGNKLVFRSDDNFWEIWTYGPDEKNPWYIVKEGSDLDGEYETFDKAIEHIESKMQ